MDNFKDKLNKIAKKDSNNWIEEAKWQRANEAWLNKSAKIALRILRHIRMNKISQKNLALKLDVSPQNISKILKGKENLTLESISKFESALGIQLIDIPSFDFKFNFSSNFPLVIPDYQNDFKFSSTSKYDDLLKTPIKTSANKNYTYKKAS